MKPIDFIGEKATCDQHGGQIIWGVNKEGDVQMLLDVRGWGAIQHLFKTEQEAANFQDELGAWFVEAINEKMKRERK